MAQYLYLKNLAENISLAALAGIREHESYARGIAEENRRRRRRSTAVTKALDVQTPEVWDYDDGFNPYHVRKRAEKIAKSITAAIRNGTYTPRRPSGFEVPKSDGTPRFVTTFQIADEVVSSLLFHSLNRKNSARFSARSYAYRANLSPHDAIEYVAREVRGRRRLFVAEFDFTKFFDNISHDHLFRTLEDAHITATAAEHRVLRQFMTAPEPYKRYSELHTHEVPRTVGVPQGTSISLFLANLSAMPLDRRLEQLGVNFARYADDTVIWSEEYSQINYAVNALQAASADIGASLNFKKSPGIRILVQFGTEKAEMPIIDKVDFLGHSISLESVRMKDEAVRRLKTHINELIYDNLLREPTAGTLDPQRVTGVDWDYLVLVSQLRRYLYGPLSEAQVRAFTLKESPPTKFEGFMSFYPLVDDIQQLKKLDGWIVNQIVLALRKRQSLVGGTAFPFPWGVSKDDLLKSPAAYVAGSRTVDLRLPSLARISRILRAVLAAFGPSSIKRRDPYIYGQ